MFWWNSDLRRKFFLNSFALFIPIKRKFSYSGIKNGGLSWNSIGNHTPGKDSRQIKPVRTLQNFIELWGWPIQIKAGWVSRRIEDFKSEEETLTTHIHGNGFISPMNQILANDVTPDHGDSKKSLIRSVLIKYMVFSFVVDRLKGSG